MTELQALLTLGFVTVAVALLLLVRVHRRLHPNDRTLGHTTTNESGQIPVQDLAIGLPLAYVVDSIDGETVVSLPSASPLFAVFAGGALIGGVYAIQSLGSLLTSSTDRGSAFVGIAFGLLFVVSFGYVSWPALFRKRHRAKLGLLSTEWALPIGPALWTRNHPSVTRLIVRQGRWKGEGSTDQVVIDDGARRYVAETIWNLPGYGSFRWFNNWKVAGSSPLLRSNPTEPWRSASPVVLALAGHLARALQVPVFFEIGRGRPPLITFGDD